MIDGAKQISNSYTNAGQNTAYFYKWDVVGTKILKSGSSQTVSSSDMFWHQYMTNVQDPTSQSKTLYNTYAKNGILDKSLNFIIPIYEDMPSSVNMPSGFSDDTEDLYYVNCTDGLRVRNKASTSGSILTTLYKKGITKIYTYSPIAIKKVAKCSKTGEWGKDFMIQAIKETNPNMHKFIHTLIYFVCN